MKFVIAPDKFKDSLTGFEFCGAVEEGLRKVFPNAEILKLPLADGGDGTMDVVKHYIEGETISHTVNDPFFRPIKASYLYSRKNQIAYIEMSEASGLRLLKEEERNCMRTTTLGTGELISNALNRGAKEIILGIGGSATNDCGMGMATALGFEFYDNNENMLLPIGENLIHVNRISSSNKDQRLNNVKVKVACDVTNPLFGDNGAAYIYAEQKGATKEDIVKLDDGLKNMAQVLDEQFYSNIQGIEGAGAAGGLGAGTRVFLNASLTSGIELIKEIVDFDTKIKGSHWIITGEGKLDGQTLSGKTIHGVLNSAKKRNIPVAAFCGAMEISIAEQEEFGLDYAVSIVQGVSNLDEAMANAYANLVHAAYNFAKLLKQTF
ncbi:glycerate kinase [Maribacter sp. CXY002]|uniref:glycerate kinase n=1 Tax=Maribacter luteocoastalis TaxID=3407671 RepID=UPI003B67CEA5